jgi:hypothetical protein
MGDKNMRLHVHSLNNIPQTENRGLYRGTVKEDIKLVLIPLKNFCTITTEVVSLIEKLFIDIKAGRDLSDFKIAKETQKGIASAITDSLILEPNVYGFGISLNKLTTFFSKKIKI